MKTKLLPYIFLFVLLIIAVFLFGLQYGKRVQDVNELVAYVMSITPSPTIHMEAPKSPTPVAYKRVMVKPCAVSFTAPDTFESTSETSTSARIAYETQPAILVSCARTIVESPNLPIVATVSGVLDSASISATLKGKENKQYEILVKHPRTGKNISLTIPEGLYSLVSSSFVFE